VKSVRHHAEHRGAPRDRRTEATEPDADQPADICPLPSGRDVDAPLIRSCVVAVLRATSSSTGTRLSIFEGYLS
jgi:hypothetical protein